MGPPENSSSSSNNGQRKDLESLGEALAGVSLGSNTSTNFGSSVIAAAPFSIAPGAPPPRENNGWGHFSSNKAATNALEKDQANDHESIQLFLSQSPSQTLGDDVFKFSHTNLPALAEEQQNGTVTNESFGRASNLSIASNGFGEIRPQETGSRRRTDSPSCSATGTTTSSRSSSPYGGTSGEGSSNRNNIHAYGRFADAPATADTSLGHSHGSHPSLPSLDRSPYQKDRNQIKSSYDNSSSYSSNSSVQPYSGVQTTQLDPPVINPSSAGNGQVLYMAIPSPDGRGQVLQPVQMMQMPGKPYTYVVPGAAANQIAGAADPSMTVLPPTNNDYSIRKNNKRTNTNEPSESLGYTDRDEFKAAASFQTDPALTSLYSAPQRPPLDALLGQVRRLSRDQVGCRLVQQALDEEGPMAATMILQEGLAFWGEAMVDPFGNYLFQKILEKVTPEERIMLVNNVSPRLVNASLNLHGTRSVQKVVELCAQDEQQGRNVSGKESAASILTRALMPAAARLCIDSHGNHVIQRILLRLGPSHSQFVFDAVAASVSDVARHRHGCCVIQRCLDSPQSEARAYLVRCIVGKSLELMQDAYGNYVVQYVLDVCSDEDVHAVCESVVGKVNLLAIQKFSSNVMEKCLERCTDRVKEVYLEEMSNPDRVRELMMDPFGNYVVQRGLSVATHAQAIRLVEAMRPHLLSTQPANPHGQRNGGVRNTAGGRRIIAKICRRFPNFTLNPVGTQEELYSQNKGNYRYLNHHQQGTHMQQQGGHAQHHHHMHNHHQAKQSPMLAAYNPVGAQLQHYQQDPRVAQIQQTPQQPAYSHANPGYYDPFTDGRNRYPGM